MTFMNLDSLTPLKEKLANHRIFERINSIQELKVFMEHHIFAVWDFMSLLKKLQKDLVPSGSPWVPNPNGNLVRFINEIVMEEESDQAYGNGAEISYTSHYQIYLDAMTEVGASTETISRFVEMVKSEGINSAMQKINLPDPSRLFMSHTFKLINEGKSHEIAASFAIGRESIVPLMFKRILDQSKLEDDQVPVFRYYLVRHAELDGDHHGPMAHKLLENMSAGDPKIQQEIIEQATKSIEQRIFFWDGVLDALS
ncbi:MAG: heme oxygenase [Opitutae bacterium]|nr:heme oxygenase [Opitutae bacterium]